ncbi:MAG: polysaccharide deacetylase family protein [Pseudomonadota bacterium]
MNFCNINQQFSGVIRALLLLAAFMMLSTISALADGMEKRIALTFDDAPRGDGPFFTGSERTQQLIDALAEAEVTGAMFFVSTAQIERRNQGVNWLKAYVAAGHHLANHSHTHPWLWQSEADAYLDDIDQASQVLQQFEGYQPFYRFPYLDEGRTTAKRDAIRTGLAERGLNHGYVTVDNYDWYMQALVKEAVDAGHAVDRTALGQVYVELLMQSIEFYDEIAQEHLHRPVAHVLLLHENDLAALFIDDLVQALREQGWQIIPAVQAYRDEISTTLPDTLFNGQGRIAALAHVQGRARRELVHVSEDEAWLRAEFKRHGLLP